MNEIGRIGEYINGVGMLIKVEYIPPELPLPQYHYIFQEAEARCELRLMNGQVLNILGIFNDVNGFGSCVVRAIREMKDYITRKGISANSDIEIRVIKVVSHYRAILEPTVEKNRYIHGPQGYEHFERLRIGSSRDMPDPVETIVWSSKNSSFFGW